MTGKQEPESRQNGYFVIGMVARMVNCHPQTIRYYERLGLINPLRTSGNVRLFSQRDVNRLEKIQSYTDLGVNLAGVEMLLRLLESFEELKTRMEQERESLLSELERLRRKKNSA